MFAQGVSTNRQPTVRKYPMRRLSLLLAALVLVLMVGSDLVGQDKKDDKTKLTGKLPTYWTKLGLSDEQKQKVYKIQNDFHEKLASLEKQLKDLKAQEKSDLEKVLTDGQKLRLKELILSKAGIEEKKD